MVQEPAAVIIDGYNLIKRIPALASRLRGAAGLENTRSYLLGWLRSYHAARRRRVILVLDGPRSSRSDFGPVEVHYAPSADQVITAIAAPGALVVTSDLTLAINARSRGAEVLSSEDFWAALTATAHRQQPFPTGGAGARYPQRGRPGGGQHGSGSGRYGKGDSDRDEDDDDRPGSGGERRGGNPRRRSKAERRRERERTSLMRKV
jgi:predicted RNA-binding protein with PIN domain